LAADVLLLPRDRLPTSAAATLNVVNGQAPTVSLTAPANNSTLTAPANVTLTANATPSDTASTISKVDFYAGGTLIGTVSAAPHSITFKKTSWPGQCQPNPPVVST
jgi:hypothetical protein